ncbi:GGDEF domain-containing protein [Bacillus sp. BGMRC 2118]|nr:GGDEF domain-containing protein [Bacillus sp. BGMRC 2118]
MSRIYLISSNMVTKRDSLKDDVGGSSMKGITTIRSPFYLCIPVVLLFLLVVPDSSLAKADDDWNLDAIEEQLFTEDGHKEIVKQFDSEREALKKSNQALFSYLEGIRFVTQNNLEKANQHFLDAADASKDREQLDIEVAALKQLVLLADYYGDSGSLIEYGSRLEEIAISTDDTETQMYANYIISLSFYYITNDEKAIEYLEKMLLLANAQENIMYQAIYKTVNGNILLSYQENEKALSLYEEAGEMYKKIKTNEGKQLERMNASAILIAKSKLKQGNQDNLQKEMEQLIHFFSNKYHETINKGYLYTSKGLIEQEYEQYQDAVKSFERVKELTGDITHIDNHLDPYRFVNINLAQAYYSNGEYRQAADLYMAVSERDENAESFISYDQMTSKVREFTEKELKDQIGTLTALKEEQKKSLFQQRIILGAFILGILVVTRAFFVKRREHRIVNNLKNSLYVQSITDGLTGVYNRKRIFELLHAQEYDCVVALVDIDNFKTINDTYGYLFGDEVIRQVVQTIQSSIRQDDEMGRYGGEEFLLILKNSDIENALPIFERIRKNVEELKWEHEDFTTTISIGVAMKSNMEAEEIFRRVDDLVHEAKRSGKNKVIYTECEAGSL